MLFGIGSLWPPSNFTAKISDFQTESFTIFLSWEVLSADHNISYAISVKMTENNIAYNTTMPPLLLEGFYNVPMLISVVTVNCGGHSISATRVVHEGNLT